MRNIILLCAVGLGACGSDSKGKNAEAEPAEEAARPDGAIVLTAEQETSARIAIAKAETRTTTGLLQATAEVQPSGDGVARVGPRLGGRIISLAVGIGEQVKKGQTLAIVDAPELARAKAEYLSAAATWKVARETADREKALADKKISSEADWRHAEAEAARSRADMQAAASALRTMGLGDAQLGGLDIDRRQTSSVAVVAPIAGVVVERTATLGQMAEPSDALFVIMDLRQVWVQVDVFERDLAQVKLGQKVTARVAAYDRAFPGSVAAIGAVVEPKTRAIQVRVALPNDDGALKPGMFASVELEGTSGVARPRVVIPSAAVQRDGDRTIVFVPRGEHTFVARPVKIAGESGGWVEVEKGLAAGDDVVTTGSFVLKSEARKGEMGED
ncbi:MAG TPA: efflux RND transporter periplasmic adaptor subunit [Kofleriaceae bacterium]|nr:efflux RND transporter periplasmic adaptor subunit [Kofleriaceae bacterium]